MDERVCAAVMDPWMENVVSSPFYTKGMPPGMLADWNPKRAPREHTCDVQTAKTFSARMKSKGARGSPTGCLVEGESSPLAADRSPRRGRWRSSRTASPNAPTSPGSLDARGRSRESAS